MCAPTVKLLDVLPLGVAFAILRGDAFGEMANGLQRFYVGEGAEGIGGDDR
jgi:hypothetical protein